MAVDSNAKPSGLYNLLDKISAWASLSASGFELALKSQRVTRGLVLRRLRRGDFEELFGMRSGSVLDFATVLLACPPSYPRL